MRTEGVNAHRGFFSWLQSVLLLVRLLLASLTSLCGQVTVRCAHLGSPPRCARVVEHTAVGLKMMGKPVTFCKRFLGLAMAPIFA